MIACWLRRLLRHVDKLDCIFYSQPRFNSRRKKLKSYAKRCIFAGLMFHFCGCDIAIDPPLDGDEFHSSDFTETEGILHPLVADVAIPVGTVPWSLNPVSVRASMEMEFFPDRVPESVHFIYRSDPSHELLVTQPPLAAAFVLKVSAPKDSGQSNLFLVTARDVLDPQWAHCAEPNPGSIVLRLNRRTGGVGYETVQLQRGSAPTFFTSPDPAVDLALIPLDDTVIANLDDYKLGEISFDDLIHSSDLPFLGKDLPVWTARYLASFAQGQVPYPIRNAVSISEIRDDVTDVSCRAPHVGLQQDQGAPDEVGHSLRHLWFISADASEGLIGAPVFVNLERVTGGGRVRVLLGIQSNNGFQKGLVGMTPSTLLGDIVGSILSREASKETLLRASIKPDNWRIVDRKMPSKSR